MLGQMVEVVIDRPLGSTHPDDSSCIYPINYGFVPGVLGGDGEEQDVYVMGVTGQISRFYGRVVAVIHRLNDNEDKWVAAPEGIIFSEDEIRAATHFIEQYFESEITLWHEGVRHNAGNEAIDHGKGGRKPDEDCRCGGAIRGKVAGLPSS